jgi:Txe/YoeB family toxin of Txe-Axe toxin-antitoxin module
MKRVKLFEDFLEEAAAFTSLINKSEDKLLNLFPVVYTSKIRAALNLNYSKRSDQKAEEKIKEILTFALRDVLKTKSTDEEMSRLIAIEIMNLGDYSKKLKGKIHNLIKKYLKEIRKYANQKTSEI